jgi:NADH-quinone oxidoreductase subunit M
MLDTGFPILSAIIFFPLLACVCLFFFERPQWVRVFTLIVSLVEVYLTLPLLKFQFGTASFQFVERVSWLPGWGLQYYLGVDGISVLMVWL